MADDSWAGARGDKWSARIDGTEGMLRPVDEPLIHALRVDSPLTIADIGCGGGGATREILRRSPAGTVVDGFDISPVLINVARRRAAAAGQAISFEVADMATAAPRKAYDRLASRFGVMFFADPAAAFANLARWLAPGGRFAFAVWGDAADNPWLSTVRQCVAGVVDVPAIEPDAPGPFRYADPRPLIDLLARAGFADVVVNDWRGAIAVGDGLPAAEAATFALATFGMFAELLAAAGSAALEAARASLSFRYAADQRDGIVSMAARVHIVTGTRR